MAGAVSYPTLAGSPKYARSKGKSPRWLTLIVAEACRSYSGGADPTRGEQGDCLRDLCCWFV